MSKLNVLLVEDSQGDIVLIEDIVSQTKDIELSVITDGKKALKYLKNTVVVPNLILLDINLPKINGLQLIKSIRKKSKFNHTPVIILTTSLNEEDKRQAFMSNANSFVTKSFDPFEFEATIIKLLNCSQTWKMT